MKMKGIILAAGRGTRLYPATGVICKPLLSVYDKPMVYYPLSLLIEAGIDDIMLIIPPADEERFRRLLGDGSQLGISLRYRVQHEARGIADAFLIGADFIENSRVCLALGDNIFYHPDLHGFIEEAASYRGGAAVLGCWSDDPGAFGVLELGSDGSVLSIEEKPQSPKSNYIVPGLYFYDGSVTKRAANLKPSARGELEITDINKSYLEQGRLRAVLLPRDTVWFDAGTSEGIMKAGLKIMEIQRNGRYVGCIEEAAYRRGFIGCADLALWSSGKRASEYGRYIMGLAEMV